METMSDTFRRDVSINLGLYNPTLEDTQTKRQSLLRSWRRLSSLQRMIIGMFLLICMLLAFYILPSYLSSLESKALPIDPANNGPGENVKLPDDPNLKSKSDDMWTKKPSPRQEHKDIIPKQMDNPNSNHEDDMDEPQKEDNKNKEQLIPPVDEHAKPKKMTSNYDFFNGQKPNEKQEAIRAAFRHAWKGYKKYAWGHDELLPISKTYSEWFSTGLTIVDSLDTAIVMGLKEEYDEGRKWIEESLNFNINRNVNLFEVTIRILGSLLSCFHLTGDELFKNKAVDLGDRLLHAFNHNSKIPYSDVNLGRGSAQAPRWGPDSSTSEVTTIQLEFRDLSHVTGDKKYADAVNEVSMHVHDLPKMSGLVPIFINADSGEFRSSSTITLGARADTYYEYLLKQWIQSGKQMEIFKNDFIESVAGIKSKLVRKSEPSKLTFIGELLSGKHFSPKMDHLACYFPGTLALAHHNGLSESYLEMAKELAITCWEMYNRMPTKLSPEITYFNLAPGAKEDLIVKPLDSHNLLRPEAVESFFVLYRLTGNQIYRDWGWVIFQAFEKYTRVADAGYSSIHNVKDAGNPRFRNKMESFFLAETLKYLYLLFSDDPNLISLDDYVFNSEAHPLPVYNGGGNDQKDL